MVVARDEPRRGGSKLRSKARKTQERSVKLTLFKNRMSVVFASSALVQTSRQSVMESS